MNNIIQAHETTGASRQAQSLSVAEKQFSADGAVDWGLVDVSFLKEQIESLADQHNQKLNAKYCYFRLVLSDKGRERFDLEVEAFNHQFIILTLFEHKAGGSWQGQGSLYNLKIWVDAASRKWYAYSDSFGAPPYRSAIFDSDGNPCDGEYNALLDYDGGSYVYCCLRDYDWSKHGELTDKTVQV